MGTSVEVQLRKSQEHELASVLQSFPRLNEICDLPDNTGFYTTDARNRHLFRAESGAVSRMKKLA